MEHLTKFCLISKEMNIADYDVCRRLMSRFADVNIQPSAGMLAVHGVLCRDCFVKQPLNFIPHMYRVGQKLHHF